jgi:hypothetical protein
MLFNLKQAQLILPIAIKNNISYLLSISYSVLTRLRRDISKFIADI